MGNRSLAVAALLGVAGLRAADPPKKATEYAVQATIPECIIAADYLGRTISSHDGSYHTADYVVVDVAVFPARNRPLRVSTGHFLLRVNGKHKEVLHAQTSGMVAGSLKYPDWDRRGRLDTTVGAGPVIIGQPAPVPRFPGDPRGRRTPQPRAPEPEDRSGVEKAPRRTADEIAVEEALPEGETEQAVRGFVYFPYRGKLKNWKSVELLYDPGTGSQAALKLQ